MNPDLNRLQAYPFEKLAQLKQGIKPADKAHIALSIGEPRHAPPAFVLDELAASLDQIGRYPLTKGLPELRQAIAGWLNQRFGLNGQVDFESQVLPVNGTREALFAFAQAVVNRSRPAKVFMPNPFYQIYEGAALLAGAEPYFYNTLADNHYLPDFDAIDEKHWQDCQLLYICSPGNPTGAVIPLEQLKALIKKAEQYDFIIASDECYSEIYFNDGQPPAGLLQAAIEMGNGAFKRCVVFHSLSKRSNLPGLRSGFVAGDAEVLKSFFQYRTYHGCAMSVPLQMASIKAWQDEQHVVDNRHEYQQKFKSVLDVLQPVIDVNLPDAGFYLWLKTPIQDTDFAQQLFQQQNMTVVPGQYLSRHAHGINPGENHIRMALVAEQAETLDAAQRLKTFIEQL